MTIPLAPAIPDPSNQDTFNDNMYPFMQWMADATTTINRVGNWAVRQQAIHTLQSPYYYSGVPTSTYTHSVGTTYYFPFYVLRPITLTALAVYTAAGTQKLCIASELNGKPSAKIVETSALTAASTSFVEGAITSTTLYPNTIYFFGIALSASHQVYYDSNALSSYPSFTSSTTFVGAGKSYCFAVTEAYASAFTTFTGFSDSINTITFYSKGAYL